VRKSDLTGQSFGQLTVIRESQTRTKSGLLLWECLCSCGSSHLVQPGNLKCGGVQSCGCLRDLTNKLVPRKRKPETVCIIDGCDKPGRDCDRTLCKMHSKRLRVHGDVNYITPESVRASRQRDSILKTKTAQPNTYKKLFGRHEHRVIGEQLAGRPLRSDEHVHHKDEDKHNNSPDNLQVMTRVEHLRHHAQKRSRELAAA
jgi:hypothetical protein